MTVSTLQFALLIALALGLVYACWTDWTRREIDQWLNAAIAISAPAFWYATGLTAWPGIPIQLAIAAVFFILFMVPFALNQMAGGDLKLIGALALWFPLTVMIDIVVSFSIIGAALSLAFLAHNLMRKRQGKTQEPSIKVEVPYGIAIAFGALWVIYERYLNHFG
jgi:prepilin peptidase CpaA